MEIADAGTQDTGRFETVPSSSVFSVTVEMPPTELKQADPADNTAEVIQEDQASAVASGPNSPTKEEIGNLQIGRFRYRNGAAFSLDQSNTVSEAIEWKLNQDTIYRTLKYRVRSMVDSLLFQGFIFACIIVDMVILLTRKKGMFASALLIGILAIYGTEIILRIYAYGPRTFFRNWLNDLEVIVVLICAVFTALQSWHTSSSILMIIVRVVRIMRIGRVVVKFCQRVRSTPTALREEVRLNKQGYRDERFNLDLCYITSRLIAMSLPSDGLEQMYRNPISEVAEFLDLKHPDKYMIFDTCQERTYDSKKFHDRVVRLEFQDHGVPTISNILRLCTEIDKWMQEDQENVVCVHCKGGKGRTGTMCASWLVCQYVCTADEAIDHFAYMRTDYHKGSKEQGIETRSQLRYVRYFHTFLEDPTILQHPKTLNVKKVEMGPLFDDSKHKWQLRIRVREESYEPNDKDTTYDGEFDVATKSMTFTFGNDGLNVCGNVQFALNQTKPDSETIGAIWINTYFPDTGKLPLRFERDDIDVLARETSFETAPASVGFTVHGQII